MEGYRELHLLAHALRGRVIDPGRLASVLPDWDDHTSPGLMTYLSDRGVISPDDLHRLESVVTEQSVAHPRPDPALEATQDPAGNVDATVDLPTSNAPTGLAESGERYKVIRLHQSGGLGRVWLARDNSVGRNVALKTIRPERANNPATRARFVREAQVTGQLEHPCIVPLYDLASGGMEPYYVMRFVSRSVMTGFVNALAILIVMAQLPELIGVPWPRGPTSYCAIACRQRKTRVKSGSAARPSPRIWRSSPRMVATSSSSERCM